MPGCLEVSVRIEDEDEYRPGVLVSDPLSIPFEPVYTVEPHSCDLWSPCASDSFSRPVCLSHPQSSAGPEPPSKPNAKGESVGLTEMVGKMKEIPVGHSVISPSTLIDRVL